MGGGGGQEVSIDWQVCAMQKSGSPNNYRAYTIMWLLVIIYKHLEIYSKIISRLRLGDYKPIFTLPSASRHLAFANYVPKIQG